MGERRFCCCTPVRFAGPNRRCIVRGGANAVLLVLAIAALAPSLGVAQYTPRWEVGTWWVVKEWQRDPRGGMSWQHRRYDVIGIDEVSGRDCFVLQEEFGDTTPARGGIRSLYYVRTDNWRIVRRDMYFQRAGKLVGPSTVNYPQGMFGPRAFEPRLPLFPLDTVPVRDSAFRDYEFPYSCAYLRQLSGTADSDLLDRYLSEPDPSGGRPVQPGGGTMFSMLSEMGAPRDSVIVPSLYSLQLWSSDYPWRLYEEEGEYSPEGGARRLHSRSWLVAWGRARRR
jgi:hypothetical protein